jgi:hypothetical protein
MIRRFLEMLSVGYPMNFIAGLPGLDGRGRHQGSDDVSCPGPREKTSTST